MHPTRAHRVPHGLRICRSSSAGHPHAREMQALENPSLVLACGGVRPGRPLYADLLVESTKAGLNPAMTRSNYAVWRKFNGVVGRVVPVAKQQAAALANAATTPA